MTRLPRLGVEPALHLEANQRIVQPDNAFHRIYGLRSGRPLNLRRDRQQLAVGACGRVIRGRLITERRMGRLTPAEAIARFNGMQAKAPVEHFTMMLPPGLPPAQFKPYAEVFAQEVIPAFR